MTQNRDGGLYLGLTADKHRNIVSYGEDRQVILYGPSGSGKDTGVIIPQLARTPTSVLVLDPKGEAAAITARWRAKHFGRVIIMNPFDVLVDTHPWLKSTGFNPLATIDADDDMTFTDDCEAISLGIIREVHGGDGAFFSGSAQDLVTALIMYDKLLERSRPGYKASLGNVRRLLTEPFGGTKEGPTGLARTIWGL
jgi:type IV secretion system protein VirD4